MTTIVYRAGVVAADTAVFDRGVYCGEAVKVFETAWGVGGVAGCLGDSALFRDWLLEGAAGAPEFGDSDSEGLLIGRGGKIEWIGKAKKRIEIVAPYLAIGSGFRTAMGALAAGKSAEEAVAICADLDAYTRRPLTVLRVAL